MKLEIIDNNEVVCPENELDREVLQYLLVHMKPDIVGYWDVISNAHDPMDGDDRKGKVYVSWEGPDKARQLDPFSLCKIDGFLRAVNMRDLKPI